jgi:hypothetical protein
MPRMGVHQYHQVIRKTCVLNVGVFSPSRGSNGLLELEHVLKRELYLPLCSGLGLKCGACDGAKRSIAAVCRRKHIRIGGIKIRMIGQVEDLCPELQLLPFSQHELSVETQVEVF